MPIEPVADDAATPELKRIFEALAPSGKVAPFFRMLAHKPAILRAYNQVSGRCGPMTRGLTTTQRAPSNGFEVKAPSAWVLKPQT